MKTTTQINVLLLSLLAFLLAAPRVSATGATTNNVMHSCCSAGESATSIPLTDKSLYQLDAAWTNDFGQPLQLSALNGRPQVVTMFFANCQYACPLLVYKMKQVEASLTGNGRTNIGFTLISFDTKRDTPQALHNYRAQHELAQNWTLLHGTADGVLDLAALLRVKFKRDAQGQFLHSNVITVLNSDGEITFQEVGLNLEPAQIVREVERLYLADGR